MLLLLLACTEPAVKPADTAAMVDPLAWAVAEPGPFNVGYQSFVLAYEPVPGAEVREVSVGVWVPTEASEGGVVRYDGLVDADPSVLGDAPAAPSAYPDGYPVLAYTHGDQGWGATSEFLMRHAASHGWVAVAPSHTDNLLWANVDPSPPLHWLHRAQDVRRAVDALPEQVPGVDTSAWVVAGHSRGVTTVWSLVGATFDAEPEAWCPGCTPDEQAAAAALADPRVVGGVALAGSIRRSLFGDTGHAAVDVPLLAMAGSEDPVGQQEQFDTTAGVNVTWVELEGGCHQTFALGTCATLPTDDGWRLTQTYALAFARRHLLGDAGAAGILDGADAVDPRATVQHHD